MNGRLYSRRAPLFVLLAGSLLAACESDLTELTEAVGPIAFNFAVGPDAADLPAGAANRQIVRTLQQQRRVWYTVAGRFDTVMTLPSGQTQDTLAMDSAAVVLTRGLRALASGVYQVWAQTTAGTMVPVYGRVVEYSHYFTGDFDPVTGDSLFAPDSVGFLTGGANTYAGSDDPVVDSVAFQLIPSDAANTTNPFDIATINALLVSIESGAATTPGAMQFLWRRIGLATGGTTNNVTLTVDTVILSTNPPGAGDPIPDTLQITTRARSTLIGTGALSFGNFGGLDVINAASPRDYVFAPRGGGLGGARGPELSVDFRELARPPVGFFYRGYVVDVTGNGVLVDTLRSEWRPDGLSRVSLYDADVNDLVPTVQGGEIRSGQVRNCASGSGVNKCQNSMALPGTDTFSGLAEFQLKLEPKGGVAERPNRSVSMTGALPEKVK
jgi:hypothetical protein